MTVRVSVSGAGAIVSAGLRSLLTREDLVEFVDGDPHSTRPDVIVYDVIGTIEDGADELWELIDTGIPVIALGRPLRPDLAARAVAHGAVVTLPTETTCEELMTAVLAAAAHEPIPVGIHEVPALGGRGGRQGLTPREIEVLRCVAAGMSNRAICDVLSLTMNTVKSYIRTAYRKIGVTSRPQAMVWCLQNGFDPAPAEEPSG